MRWFALVPTALILALPQATAHADENSYIPDLQAAGVPILSWSSNLISQGYIVCAQLRGGESPATAANQFGIMNAFGTQIVSVTQHDLCPDTIR